MNIISFSLWGEDPKYIKGALLNVSEAKRIYPGWGCRFYCESKMPSKILTQLSENAEVILVESEAGCRGSMWRFAALDDDAEVVILRDADSVVNTREAAAVKEWLDSTYQLHGMRDHYEHNVPIMAGMWGCKEPSKLFDGKMKEITTNWQKDYSTKGVDQNLLQEFVWNKYAYKMLVHDKYPKGCFVLPDKSIKLPSDLSYYNKYDNCGDDKLLDYPRGKIAFKDGQAFQRLSVYEYSPIEQFGPHEIRPFPDHLPIKYGTHVGEIIDEKMYS